MGNISKVVLFELLKLKKLLLFSIIFSFYLLPANANVYSTIQQQIVVKGVVKDNITGETLPGVGILLEGTSNGAITDIDGNYSIKVTGDKAVLVFSYVGYASQKMVIGKQTNININLVQDVKTLDEVVVMGYGTIQKKINVTGAVSTVKSESLVSSGFSNITTALVGNASGVSGLQTSGEPGQNGTKIFIRGRSSFSGTSDPLIVIDGIEQASEQAYSQLNAMDPNEIGSVSVLKDASSTAVYGIRGANGVIVVTTKRGNKSKPTVSFSSTYGYTEPISLNKTSNSYDWAIIRNEAVNYNKNQMGDPSFNGYLFSEDQLWKFKNGRDYTPAEVDNMTQLTDAQKATLNESSPIWYGSKDYINEIFNHKGPQKQINTNISGGTDKMKYFASIGYFNQGSILGNTTFAGSNTGSTYKRYNYRTTVDLNPLKNLDISITMAGQFGTTSGPAGNAANQTLTSRYTTIMQYIAEENPWVAPPIIDGKLINGWSGTGGTASNPVGGLVQQSYNPLATLLLSGQGITENTLLSNTLKIKHTLDYLTEGLSVRGSLSYDDNYSKSFSINPKIPTYSVTRNLQDPNILVFTGGVQGPTQYELKSEGAWNKLYFDAGIDYVKSFGDHNITLLALGKASLYRMPNESSLAVKFNTPSGIIGLVGRATYNYKEKYMTEVSMGYNGTEQFAKGKRFGFFPSFSAGWVLTNETFMSFPNWVDMIKVRGSYGKVGSDDLNRRRYLYLSSSYLQDQGGYYLGTATGSTANPQYKGSFEGALGNPILTWELSTKTGFGLDSRFLNNRLVLNLDLFNEKRTNILVQSGIIPLTFGVPTANIPPVNVGETSNQGYEATIEWRDRIGDFNYGITTSLSHARNKIDYRAEAPNPYYWQNQTGLSIGQYSGLISDGFYNTPEELANRTYNTYSAGKHILGDIRYKDINGDGKIDEKDIVPIGNTNLPLYSYSFRLRLGYKGFDINALLNGSFRGSYYLNDHYTYMLSKQSGMVYQWQVDDRWTPEKVADGSQILYPRPSIDGNAGPNFLRSDFWLKSTDFLRLKNLEIGYIFPVGWLKKAGMGSKSSLRIYANASNLWTSKNEVSKYGVDPEMTDDNAQYLFPLTRVLLCGVNVTF